MRAGLGRHVTWLAVLSLFALSGCERAPLVAAEAVSSRQESEWRALALHAMPLTPAPRSVERNLARAQIVAKQTPTRAASWVDVGEAWILIARDRSDPGFYLHAEASANLALAIAPTSSAALRLRIATRLNKHEFAQARDEAQMLIASDPADATAHALHSDALIELGELAAATASVDKMIVMEDSLAARSRRAWLRFLKNDVAGALEDARVALDDGSATQEARAFVAVDAGMIAFWSGDHVRAQQMFERATAERAEFPGALVGKARIALAKNTHEDTRKAIDLLMRAWATRKDVETGVLLVDARASFNEDTRALAQEVVAHARRADARGAAVWLAERDGSPAAIEEARRIITAELSVHGDLYTHDAAAAVFHAGGDIERAQHHAERAIAHGTPDPRLWARAAIVRNDRARLQRLLLDRSLDPGWRQRVRAALDRP